MKTLDCIYTRSSVRTYKSEQVPENDIKEILKAGSYAASGMNRQPLRYVVIQDKQVINELSETIKSTFLNNSDGTNSFAIEKMKDPDYSIFHKAPTLIFTFAAPNAVTPVEDGSLSVANMMLSAHEMGYGTCFIGFAAMLGEMKDFREMCKAPEDHKYLSCMSLGIPEGKVETHPKNDVNILNWKK
jgi:Nitroreductase